MEKLTHLDKELLLAALRNYLTPEIRHQIMTQLPMAYNRWVGSEIVSVVRTENGGAV